MTCAFITAAAFVTGLCAGGGVVATLWAISLIRQWRNEGPIPDNPDQFNHDDDPYMVRASRQ